MKKYDLLVGRFQPITKAHVDIVRIMRNPVITIVRGEKSKKRDNPLDEKWQRFLIERTITDPALKITVSPNGYIPGIIRYLKENEKCDVQRVFAGSDRSDGYRKQIEKANKKGNHPKIDVEVVDVYRRDDSISATGARIALRNYDRTLFEELTPKPIHVYFDSLANIVDKLGESRRK